MPDQVVPITGLAEIGVILDNPPVSLPPNAFTNARNVRFRDGAVRKMEGEVDIFEGMNDIFSHDEIGQLEYVAWWPSPNQTTRDTGYYIFVVENVRDPNNVTHDIYAMLPGATYNPDTDNLVTKAGNYQRVGTAFSRLGKWQHTLFNGGFSFIINNGVDRPQFITDTVGNTDITQLDVAPLPGWDSYHVNETIISDEYDTDTSSNLFDTGQSIETNVTRYEVRRSRPGEADVFLNAPNDFTIDTSGPQDVLDFSPAINASPARLQSGDSLEVNFQSISEVRVSAAIVRAFGDFLVAGNLVERDPTQNDTIVRRLTGVVRTSDVAQPGSIPNNWNPFAAGASTADEFVIADTGTVQDAVQLQGNMYLYTNTSISVMRLTGNASIPLSVQPITDQYGALTTDAVLEYDGKHFVIGSDDIYLFGGHPGSIQSISDQKVRDAFFRRVNPIFDNTINLFTLRYAAKDEIWICFPTVNSVRGESDEAYIWNYRNNTWTIRTLNSVIRGDVAPVPGGGVPSAVIEFSGSSGTNDVTRVGSQEVQTIEVATTATVGHASAATQEQQTFRTLRSVTDGTGTTVPRPAIATNSVELAEIAIGTNVHPGPNPSVTSVNIPDPNASFTYDSGVLFGGARLTGSITDQTASGNVTTQVSIAANEIFGASVRLQEEGTGDQSPVFDSGVGITSMFNPRSSTTISGSNNDLTPTTTPTLIGDTGIRVTAGVETSVANNSTIGVNVDVGNSTETYDISARGTGNNIPAIATFDDTSQVAGTVRASITQGTVVDTQTNQTVVFDWINVPGSTGDSDARNGGRYPRVPAGVTLVMNDGTTYGPGQGLSLDTWLGAGNGISQAHINEIFGTNGQNLTANGTRSSVWLGGGNWSVTAPWAGGEIYRANQPGASDPAPFARLNWSTRGGLVGRINIPSVGVQAGDRSWTIARGSVGGLTTRTTVTTQTLNSVINATLAEIEFDWAGATQTIPAGRQIGNTFGIDGTTTTFTPAITVNSSDNSWTATGESIGTRFTNNENFDIVRFDTNSNTANAVNNTPVLTANGGFLEFAQRSMTWTGRAPSITVENTNTDGSIIWAGDNTDGSSTPLETTINGGVTVSDLPNFSGIWSFSGEEGIDPDHTLITATRLSGEPVDNFTFTVVDPNDTGNNATDHARDAEPFEVNDTDILRLEGNVRDTYTWMFSGDVRSTGTSVMEGSTQTSLEFLTRSVQPINNDAVPGLETWNAAILPNDLRLASSIPGSRTVNDFEFSTFTAQAATISGDDLGPHSLATTVLTDNLGDELFTVTRSGTGPYLYVVTTARDTGFPESDIIRNVQFRSGNQSFDPPENIISRDTSGFTFTSTENTWSLRAGPAATYVPLQEETFTATGNTYNENNIVVAENITTGGFTVSRTGSATVEDVAVVVSETTSETTGQTVSFSLVDVTGTPASDDSVGNNQVRWRLRPNQDFQLPNGSTVAANTTLTRAQMQNLLGVPRANDNSGLTGNWGTNFRSVFSPRPGFPYSNNNMTPMLDRTGASNLTTIDRSSSRNTAPGPTAILAQVIDTANAIFYGFGYTSNGDIISYRGESDPQGNIFYRLSRASPGVFNIPSATNFNFTVGNLTTTATGRSFRVQNDNPYAINFSFQGGMPSAVAENGTVTTFTGQAGSINEDWSWSSDQITSGDQTGDQTIQGITVDSQATTITSNTTLYQAGRPGAQRSFTAGQIKFVHITFPRNQDGVVDMVRVSDGAVFQNSRNDNAGQNFSAFGFTAITDGMAHSAGTGNTRTFFSSSVNANNATVNITGTGLTAAQEQSIRSLVLQPVGSTGGRSLSGPGIVYDNNVVVFWETGSLGHGFFDGRHQFGQTYLGTTHAGTVTAFANRAEASSAPGENFVVTNPHPFSITFDDGVTEYAVSADSTVTTMGISGNNNTWNITTPTTTQYQYQLTNNNIRPIDIAAGGTFDMTNDLDMGDFILSGFSSTRGFTASITREFLASSGTDPVVLMADQIGNPGVGDVGADQLPVTYNITNTGIGLNFDIPLAMDTTDDGDPSNDEVETTIVTALRGNSLFNQYYTLRDHNDDPAIAVGRFDLIARALPGGTFTDPDDPTNTLTFPTTPTVFQAVVDQEYGGRAALSATTVPGVATSDAPLIVQITTGQVVLDPSTGTVTPNDVNFSDHIIMISGSYPSTVAGDNELNEQFRQALFVTSASNPTTPYNTLWSLNTADNVLDPTQLRLTSFAEANHFNTLTVNNNSTHPLVSYFDFDTTQDGTGGTGQVYPTITFTPPNSELVLGSEFGIELRPSIVRTTDAGNRLTHTEIAEIIRRQWAFPGWSVSDDPTSITLSGSGIQDVFIKLVKDELATVDGNWTVRVSSYGDIGNTLSGTAVASDGNVIGRLNSSDFSPPTTETTNNTFAGSPIIRAQPTRVMVSISNPDIEGGIQYIPFVFGNDSTYNVVDQSGARGTRVTADSMVNQIQSGIINANRRVTTTLNGTTLSIIPSQFSELANFVLDVITNDTVEGVTAWNNLVMSEDSLDNSLLISSDNEGLQSYGPSIVVEPGDNQATPQAARRPDRIERQVINTPTINIPGERIDEQANPLLTNIIRNINTIFDPLRPWPTTQVNLNREFPIFATSILNENDGTLAQNFRGADLGFLYLQEPYESFVERIELALTPEFDTEQLQSIALWGDGGSLVTFGDPIQQATLDIKAYGTNNPGQTIGTFDPAANNITTNEFIIGQDYKIDMRIHGRFLNLLISDFDITSTVRQASPNNMAMDANLNVLRGISWNVSGIQADIFKGGRR